jgi:ABC-type multidrug transport system fused ATPase/permease subunit
MWAAMGFTIVAHNVCRSRGQIHTSFPRIWNLISSTHSLAHAVTTYLTPFAQVRWKRVVEYLGLPQEPPAVIGSNRPPAYWPSSSNEGHLISIENFSVKYAPDLPLVLHGINLALKAEERVGCLDALVYLFCY